MDILTILLYILIFVLGYISRMFFNKIMQKKSDESEMQNDNEEGEWKDLTEEWRDLSKDENK